MAILKCKERYEDLSVCCDLINQEFNELYKEKTLTIADKTYPLDLYFGGDMKFDQIFLGLNGACANYACPWCHVTKNERMNFSKPHDFYNTEKMKRTHENLVSNYATKQFGCVKKPLLTRESNA